MLNYIIRLVISGLAVYILPNYLKGITVDTLTTAIIVAFVMSLLNTFVKPILVFLSLPITILTLGLFYLVITVVIVYICDALVGGFKVDGFITALILSFVISIINSLVSSIVE